MRVRRPRRRSSAHRRDRSIVRHGSYALTVDGTFNMQIQFSRAPSIFRAYARARIAGARGHDSNNKSYPNTHRKKSSEPNAPNGYRSSRPKSETSPALRQMMFSFPGQLYLQRLYGRAVSSLSRRGSQSHVQ